MKVVSWSNFHNGPLRVPKGESIDFSVRVTADGGEDLHVAYLVLLGYDDVVPDPMDMPALIFSKMQKEYQDYQEVKAERDQLLSIVVEQAAGLERLRDQDGQRRWRLRRRSSIASNALDASD